MAEPTPPFDAQGALQRIAELKQENAASIKYLEDGCAQHGLGVHDDFAKLAADAEADTSFFKRVIAAVSVPVREGKLGGRLNEIINCQTPAVLDICRIWQEYRELAFYHRLFSGQIESVPSLSLSMVAIELNPTLPARLAQAHNYYDEIFNHPENGLLGRLMLKDDDNMLAREFCKNLQERMNDPQIPLSVTFVENRLNCRLPGRPEFLTREPPEMPKRSGLYHEDAGALLQDSKDLHKAMVVVTKQYVDQDIYNDYRSAIWDVINMLYISFAVHSILDTEEVMTREVVSARDKFLAQL